MLLASFAMQPIECPGVFILYSAILALGLLLTSPYWLVQMLRLGKYRAGLWERLGRVPARIRTGTPQPVLWIHAVSVGEVLATSGLIASLREQLPAYRIVLSTTTHTGQKLARERFGAENVFYFPLDFAFCIRPFLRALRPTMVVLAETEFWPNFLRLVHESGAKLAVVNGRISDRSLPRYRTWRWLLRRPLSKIDIFLAQSAEDARRLTLIGAPEERVHVSGNLKFDVKPPEEVGIVETLRTMLRSEHAGPVIVAGSTVEGEEATLLDAFWITLGKHPNATLILAPRHKERFSAVWDEVKSRHEKFLREVHAGSVVGAAGHALRRSELQGNEALAGSVLLLDSLGELASVYALADIAFVGGSLVPRGGHNILEPAHWGVATIVGLHTENFRDVIAIFSQADAVEITDARRLDETLLRLLSDDSRRRTLAEHARGVVLRQMGATQRTVDALLQLMGDRS